MSCVSGFQIRVPWLSTWTRLTETSAFPQRLARWRAAKPLYPFLTTQRGLTAITRSCAGRACPADVTSRQSGAGRVLCTSQCPMRTSAGKERAPCVHLDTTPSPGVWCALRIHMHSGTMDGKRRFPKCSGLTGLAFMLISLQEFWRFTASQTQWISSTEFGLHSLIRSILDSELTLGPVWDFVIQFNGMKWSLFSSWAQKWSMRGQAPLVNIS